ncbi:MAG: GNAT family N-acetyltransferase [Eudoraea sp.]|nr:GNAT family N-acetyltransferase [Eudoraea sp.]
MIRRAKILEIPDIMGIAKACAIHMIKQGIYQWNEDYPRKEVFENDLGRKELFVLETNGEIGGMITATSVMDEEYRPVDWLTNDGLPVYIHRLAVLPAIQGKGYARKLMDYAENLARKQGYTSVRLDTFSQNKRNQKFYEQRGYTKLGDIYFPKQSQYPFHCYEMIL